MKKKNQRRADKSAFPPRDLSEVATEYGILVGGTIIAAQP